MIVLDEHLQGGGIDDTIAKWYRGRVCFVGSLRPDTIMWAAQRDRAGTVQALVERGADVNAKDEGGKTASVWAAQEGHSDIVQLLTGMKRR